MNLYDKIKSDFITKKELIDYKLFLEGYYSDLDYHIKLETNVDYEDTKSIKNNIIYSIQEYEEKLKRDIIFDNNHVCCSKVRSLDKK